MAHYYTLREAQKDNAPKFCPNCSEAIDPNEPDALGFFGSDAEPVWDICCFSCGFTGSVAPDRPVAGADTEMER